MADKSLQILVWTKDELTKSLERMRARRLARNSGRRRPPASLSSAVGRVDMNDQPQITVRRATSYPDRFRAYEVKLDDIPVGSVRVRGALTVPVSPGKHSLLLRIDWCGSPRIDFEARPGEQLVFECGSSLAGWRLLLGLFYIIFRTKQYLWLRRAV